MRAAFLRGLTQAAEQDPRIMLLTADLGFKIFDEFAKRFPGRFFNMGVAEANMAGVAAGLALGGQRPYIYSIVPFATMRCFEQIRNDICYHKLPVTIVGVGGGYSYGHNGPTHHALEDIALMRVLPGMTVVCPADAMEAELAVRASARHDGPIYLRLGRAGEPAVHTEPFEFAFGRAIEVRKGADGAILSTGTMLSVACEAAERLAGSGLQYSVVSVPTVKPLDRALLQRLAAAGQPIVTVEEHYRAGGFGSAVSECLLDMGLEARLHVLGVASEFCHESGDQAFLRQRQGLSAEQVAASIVRLTAGVAAP